MVQGQCRQIFHTMVQGNRALLRRFIKIPFHIVAHDFVFQLGRLIVELFGAVIIAAVFELLTLAFQIQTLCA